MTIRLLGFLRRNVLMDGLEIIQYDSKDSLNELWCNTFHEEKEFPIPIDFTKHQVVMISENLRLHESLGIVNITEAASISLGIYCQGEQKESRSAFHLFMLVPREQKINSAVLTKSKKMLETTKTVKKLNKEHEILLSKGFQKMKTTDLEQKSVVLSKKINDLLLSVSGLDLKHFVLDPDNPPLQDG